MRWPRGHTQHTEQVLWGVYGTFEKNSVFPPSSPFTSATNDERSYIASMSPDCITGAANPHEITDTRCGKCIFCTRSHAENRETGVRAH